ncbi:ABC transporter permease subunit [Paenibacillus gansuensis]|uniref:ABC transporter permease subunit n=1 Tax=Paenibacillus gansuensis TaxID=306542 RepID=A0ABW5PEP1_9BACL
MSWNLIRHELRQGRRGFVTAVAVTCILLILMLAKADAVVGNSSMAEVLNSMPKSLLDAFGITPESFQSYEGYFASQAYIYIVLVAGSFAASWAITGIVKERDRGTGEFLFSLPYRRSHVFLSKAGAHFLMITAVYAMAGVIAVGLGKASAGLEHPMAIIQMVAAGYLLSLAFAGSGYALTSALSSERAAGGIGIGIVIASYLLTLMNGAGDLLKTAAKASPFKLFDAPAIARGADLTLTGVLVTLGIYAAGLLIGLLIIQRRDIT